VVPPDLRCSQSMFPSVHLIASPVPRPPMGSFPSVFFPLPPLPLTKPINSACKIFWIAGEIFFPRAPSEKSLSASWLYFSVFSCYVQSPNFPPYEELAYPPPLFGPFLSVQQFPLYLRGVLLLFLFQPHCAPANALPFTTFHVLWFSVSVSDNSYAPKRSP